MDKSVEKCTNFEIPGLRSLIAMVEIKGFFDSLNVQALFPHLLELLVKIVSLILVSPCHAE